MVRSKVMCARMNVRAVHLKLLEFLDLELVEWEDKLQQGEVPGLGDVQHIARVSRKIHSVLAKNGVLEP